MHPTRTVSRRICFGEDHGYCCPEDIYIPQPDGTAVHRDDLTNTVTPADILRYAALYLDRHGWIQGDMFVDPLQATPAACAQGAIRMAVCGSPTIPYTTDSARDTCRAIRVLAGHLRATHVDGDPTHDPTHGPGLDTDDDSHIVGDWNDEPGRTTADVLTALHEAADSWDTRHPGGGA